MTTPISATSLLEQSLAAIAEHGERTNAFILVDEAGARAAAQVVDDERRRGINRGPLHGMPISIKDLIDIAGQPTTAASKVRAGHVAQRDATCTNSRSAPPAKSRRLVRCTTRAISLDQPADRAAARRRPLRRG